MDGGRGGPDVPFILSKDLGQNKMEQLSPIPSKAMMKEQKRAILASLNWDGGGVVQIVTYYI